jgi:hypothetical protein
MAASAIVNVHIALGWTFAMYILSAPTHASFPSSTTRRRFFSAASSEILPIDGPAIENYTFWMRHKERQQRCGRCGDSLYAETVAEIQPEISVEVLICRSCRQQWFPEQRPQSGDSPVLLICHECRLIHTETGGWMTKKTFRDTTGVDPLTCRFKNTYCPWCYDFVISHGRAA